MTSITITKKMAINSNDLPILNITENFLNPKFGKPKYDIDQLIPKLHPEHGFWTGTGFPGS